MKTDELHGFTLVEVMMSMTLVILVIGISTSSWLALGRASSIVKISSEIHGDMRLAFDKMSKDVISASSIVEAEGHYFRLTANRSGTPTTVYYVFKNGNLHQLDTADRIILENVTQFSYEMYELDGITQTSNPADAYSIDVTVTAERQVGNEMFDDVFQTRIMLRNKFES